MGSISVSQLKTILENVPDDYEVVMHISEESGKKGWDAFINGVEINNAWGEIRLED